MVMVIMVVIMSFLFFLSVNLFKDGRLFSSKPWINFLFVLMHYLLGLRLRLVRVFVTGNDAASSRSCFVSCNECHGAAKNRFTS